jgi:hypothetical protein
LSYTRFIELPKVSPQRTLEIWSLGGEGWIRTNVGARPTDLQSAPFNHSGTSPQENHGLWANFYGLSSRGGDSPQIIASVLAIFFLIFCFLSCFYCTFYEINVIYLLLSLFQII